MTQLSDFTISVFSSQKNKVFLFQNSQLYTGYISHKIKAITPVSNVA